MNFENKNEVTNDIQPQPTGEQAAAAAKTVSGSKILFGRKAREARLREIVDPSLVLSNRAYNGFIGGILLWGLLINYILCSKVGVYTNLFPKMHPIIFLVGYLVMAFTGIIMANVAKKPAISFLGFNLVVVPFGVVLSTIVEAYGGISSVVVTNAFLYTLLIAVAMLATVITFPNLFEKMGGALFAVLIGLIVAEIVLLILRVPQQVTSWIAAVLFSLYLGYDIYRSQQYPRTLKNAVASALDIYMDLANLFIRILEITGKSDSK